MQREEGPIQAAKISNQLWGREERKRWSWRYTLCFFKRASSLLRERERTFPLTQLSPWSPSQGCPPPPLFHGECASLSQLLSCSIYHSLSAASPQRIHLIPRASSRCAEQRTGAAGRQQWKGLLSSCFAHRPGTLPRTAVFMIYWAYCSIVSLQLHSNNCLQIFTGRAAWH